MRKLAVAFMIMMLITLHQGRTASVLAKVWTLEEIYQQHETISPTMRKVELKQLLEVKAYRDYLEDYGILEEGLKDLKQVIEALDQMIKQTMIQSIDAKAGDKKNIRMTVGEFQSQQQKGSAMDMKDVEIVDAHVDEDTKNAVLEEVESALPAEIKEQLPNGWQDEVTQERIEWVIQQGKGVNVGDMLEYLPQGVRRNLSNVELPEATKGIGITLAVDAKTYYLQMLMPTLIEKRGEAKAAYDQLIKDNQLNHYIKMESLKIKESYSNHLQRQAYLKAQHSLNEQLMDLQILKQEKEITHDRIEFTKNVIEDERTKEGVGRSLVTKVKEVEQLLFDQESQVQQIQHDIIIKDSILKTNLGLEEKDTLDINKDQLFQTPIAPIEKKLYLTTAKSRHMDLLLLAEQRRLYKELMELAGQVYKEEAVEYQIMELVSKETLIEVKENQQLIVLEIDQIYKEYQIAYESYWRNQKSYEVALKGYELVKARYDAEQVSDRQLQEAGITMKDAKLNYDKDKRSYTIAYHRYIEAIMGLTGK